ncbi:hypothetical protein [Sporichthya sp.]|uniref:hypothetical protein n=1 Tax=Sporichthya sp. TaxID=65475 RepID=UPI001841487E|nr:hypothetical protein [Sporichthya sp.]MBA3745417.1 hypothetical protein [Sporichthya sp.]
MGVQAGQTRKRWSLVAAGLAVLCSLPALVATLPASAPDVDPALLRDRILASSEVAYAGYAESDGSLGLPDLPAIDNVGALLGSHTRIRAWESSAGSRVDVLTPTGERGLYEGPARPRRPVGPSGSGPAGLTTWDFEENVTTVLYGEPGLRLPRAADLVPPRLARRLLGGPRGDERLEPLADRRVAGVAAAGLRLVPTDPETTVGYVDVWADPRTGLPVEVRVTGRDGGAPGLRSRFLELTQGANAVPVDVLAPPYPESGARAETLVTAVGRQIDEFAPSVLPERLAGRDSTQIVEGGQALRTYGQGFSTFGAIALPGGLGFRVYDAARTAGGLAVELDDGDAILLRTPLLNLLVVTSERGYGYVLSGPVGSDLLTQAARELIPAIG